MNPSATMPLTQMILSWTLLGVLSAWMLLCAFLAFRPLSAEKQEMADLPTPSGALPRFVPQLPLHQFTPPLARSSGGLITAQAGSANEIGVAPVS